MADFSAGESAQITPFNFGTHAVRVVMRDGEPWFVAADICAALDYANPAKAVADHLDDDERSTITNSESRNGGGKLTIINESGLYALVLRSRKPEARKFAKWVTGEVLPAIRKTGGYGKASAPTLCNTHWRISFDHRGRGHLVPMPGGDIYQDLPRLLADPGVLVSTKQLAEIACACVQRLARKAVAA